MYKYSDMKIKIQETQHFSNNLRLERQRLGLTQAELAEWGGVSKTSQVSYEAGASRPDSQYLSNVARAGVNVSWLLTGKIPALDHWDIVEEILELVAEWEQVRNKPTTVAERTEVLKLLYEIYRSTGRIDANLAASAFRLAK